jgi:hypothetical protein
VLTFHAIFCRVYILCFKIDCEWLQRVNNNINISRIPQRKRRWRPSSATLVSSTLPRTIFTPGKTDLYTVNSRNKEFIASEQVGYFSSHKCITPVILQGGGPYCSIKNRAGITQQSFAPFARLPTELRLLIWKRTFIPHRVAITFLRAETYCPSTLTALNLPRVVGGGSYVVYPCLWY